MVQKISSKQTLTEIVNVDCDPELAQQSNILIGHSDS